MSESQGTLTSLAADTGGRAFTDTNDFGDAFSRVQRDMSLLPDRRTAARTR